MLSYKTSTNQKHTTKNTYRNHN